MLGTQQFCVRWNSYQTNLQDVFPKLLTNEHFVDVTLACEAQMIKCHKVVLSACSTYFEQLLVHNPCQHPIIFMKDMRHGEVQALVDFMYKGEVNVSQEELASLLKAAEALQIRGLCGADRQLDGKAVSLPPETTLSDSGGRETPPAKKRRQNETKENSIPVNTSSVGSTSNETPAATATQPLFKDSESANSSKEDDDKGSIKKEHFDIDDSYYDNDGDDALDLQDDSNSMNQEMSMPTSPLDQAGPSGMSGNPVDKAAAGMRMQHPVENLTCLMTPTFGASSDYDDGAMDMNSSMHHNASPGKARVRRSEDELRQAAECVMKGSTFQTVSDRYNIPISTIRFYMARRGILPQRRRGRSSGTNSSGIAQSPTSPPYQMMHYKLPDIDKPL